MLGPFAMSTIDAIFPFKKIGAYILTRDEGPTEYIAHYVGRSDADLANRLKDHISSGYKMFWYEIKESPMAAYHLECEWYHKYHPRDNQNHPAVPPGASWKCPIVGCPYA